ncbi:MAG TPA: transglutaminase family protein [Candidatus Ratteibacteria bacterium]|nr:transglutaminase family protein [Candidatus Ratteibacteria bacterium]
MEKEYISPTKVCDIENVDLKMRSELLTKNINTLEEKAINIFNFVREQVKYGFDYPYTKASETLKKGYGNCFNKSSLQISLLRCAEIYAGYIVYLIKKDIFKPIVPPDIYQLISESTIHVSTVVYLNNTWVECDATIDYQLYNVVYKNSGLEYEQWDGKKNLTISHDFIIEQQGIYSNIDLFLLNPPKFWTDELLQKANEYLNKIRGLS